VKTERRLAARRQCDLRSQAGGTPRSRPADSRRSVVIITALAIAITLFGGSHFEWRRDAAPWRIVTSHFTHWTYEQLAWDALAFVGLGLACARRDDRAFHATLLASAIAIPLAVAVFAPRALHEARRGGE